MIEVHINNNTSFLCKESFDDFITRWLDREDFHMIFTNLDGGKRVLVAQENIVLVTET